MPLRIVWGIAGAFVCGLFVEGKVAFRCQNAVDRDQAAQATGRGFRGGPLCGKNAVKENHKRIFTERCSPALLARAFRQIEHYEQMLQPIKRKRNLPVAA